MFEHGSSKEMPAEDILNQGSGRGEWNDVVRRQWEAKVGSMIWAKGIDGRFYSVLLEKVTYDGRYVYVKAITDEIKKQFPVISLKLDDVIVWQDEARGDQSEDGVERAA